MKKIAPYSNGSIATSTQIALNKATEQKTDGTKTSVIKTVEIRTTSTGFEVALS